MNMAPLLTPLLFLVVAAARAADAPGDEAADAPYVDSPHDIVTRMLELAEVGPDDYVVDLGSGDGRIVITAALTFGARGLGVEIREELVERARQAAALQGVSDRVRFVQQDLFDTDLSRATVVTVYLLPEMLDRVREKLERELQPGARVVSHDYPIEGWSVARFDKLDHEAKVPVTGIPRTHIYVYRMPEQAAADPS